ncbi:hypothetical protein [Streptomyces pseudovenezuelae]|uniref:hypothetical protein n=1 Tax=Streptomyces pseudovenezuelae TaxID=67350 RepID=UPI0036E2A6B6
MSEWNLSVRLTGQGSDLSRTLRTTSRDARSASRDVNALRRDIDQLRQQTRNDMRLRLRVDASRLRTDVRAALADAGTGQGLNVNLRLGNARQLRRDVSDAVRRASRGQRVQIPIVLRDPAHLRRDVDAAIRRAQNQTVRVRVVADTSDLTQIRRALGGGNGGGGGSGGGGALGGLLMLAPAAIPLISGLSTSLAPLPGMFAAAGVSAGAFGAAIAGQIEPLSEVADAEKKYREAVRENGAASAEALKAQIAYQKTLKSLPPDTQRAAIALSDLKSNFSSWSNDMASFTMTPLTHGITILDQIIHRLTPEVQTASTQLDRLVTIAGGAVETPGFDAMARRFADFTDHQLDQMTDQVIHFIRLLSEGKGVTSGPIAEFVAYAKENGPEAREALKAISEAVVTLLRAASQAGPSMLTLVTAAAQLVAALPPELVGIILQVATALKLLQLTGAGMAALAGGLTRVRTAIVGLSAASAAAGGGLAGLRAAFMSLGIAARATLIASGIGILVLALSQLSEWGKKAPPNVDKLTSSLRSFGKTGKVTGETARSFGKDLSGLADAFQKVKDPKGLDQVQQSIVSFFGTDSTPVKEAKEQIDAVDQALSNLVRNGNADLAQAALDGLVKKLRAQGFSAEYVRGQMDDYKSALADAKFEQELAAASMGVFGKAAQDTQAKLDAQKLSADGLRQSIVALNDVNRAAGSAMSAFEESIDEATKAIKDHAGALKMRDGELDLGSSKAREAEKSLSDLAANTDAAATAAREQGKSWKYVNGIYSRGRKAFIDAADAMGLTKTQAEALADTYLDMPDRKTIVLEMQTEDAIAGLDSVIAAIKKTPNAKSVKVNALTAEAQTLLEQLGFKIVKLKDGRFSVIADTATAKTRLSDVEAARDGLKDKTIKIDAATQKTIAELESVKAKIASTKGKTITMKAPTAEARKQLEDLGFKIRNTKGKNVVITVPTGSQRSGVAALRAAIAALHDKSITITTTRQTVFTTKGSKSAVDPAHRDYARGGIVDYYAGGGIRQGTVSFFANGSTGPGDRRNQHMAQIVPAGSWRVFGEDETQGEGYVPFRASARPRSRKITEEIVRRLGGNPEAIQWNADGGITAFAAGGTSYTPTGTIRSISDVQSAYSNSHQSITKDEYNKKIRARANAVDSLRAAEARLAQLRKRKHTHAQLVAAENAVAKARRSVATATDAASAAQARYKKQFSLSDWGKTLSSTVKANAAYEANLKKIASRGGSDIIDQLRDMGAEGATMVSALAKASKSQFNSIIANLRKLGPLAKATLADFTAQLNTSTKTNSTFQANLAKLAGMGYGDLATQLAAQGDDAAQKLAAEAVKSKSAAGKANTAAKNNANSLSSEQLTELVQIIAAISSKSTGIHDVAAKTGLGEDEIITVANKARSQISGSLGSRASRFLDDLGKANKHLAYADGGIRAGMYATRGGIVRFAEPQTGGEAYLPLSPSKRRSALPVLADVAHRFGVGLTDASASRPVVIVRDGDTTHVQVTAVRTGATASDIGSQVGRSVRRARRGGVNARAAA